MTEPVRIAEAELTGRRAQLATALGGELSARLGRELALEADAVQRLGVLELAPSDDALVHQRLGFSSGEGALHVLLPVRTAALFAALEQGASGEALEAALAAEPDAAALSALTQVMESVADVLRRNFEDLSEEDRQLLELLFRQDQDQPNTRRNLEIYGSNNPSFATFAVLASVGETAVPFGQPWQAAVTDEFSYRYIRVQKTKPDADLYGQSFFNLAEVRVWAQPFPVTTPTP